MSIRKEPDTIKTPPIRSVERQHTTSSGSSESDNFSSNATADHSRSEKANPSQKNGRPRKPSSAGLIRDRVITKLQPSASWEHDVYAGDPPTVRRHDPSHQMQRTLLHGIMGWMMTVLICLALFGTFYGYSRKFIMSTVDQHVFNFLQNLFVIGIGISVGAGLSSYAKIMSWRLLASKYRTLEDFDLVMGIDSSTNVLTLLWRGRKGHWRPSRTQLICLICLLVTIGMEMASTLLGFVHSIEVVNDRVAKEYGQVSVVQLDNIWDTHSTMNPSINGQRGISNVYGLIGQNYPINYTEPETAIVFKEAVFTNDNKTFSHRFVNQCPSAEPLVLEYSDRDVGSTATCRQLQIISGGYIEQRTLVWNDTNGNRQVLYIPGMSRTTTTYMSINQTVCGPRCAQVMVLNTGDVAKPLSPPQLFLCNNTISQVSNASHYEHPESYLIPDTQAQIIAGAIGWSGNQNDSTPWQFQTYSHNSYWSWEGVAQTVDDVAKNIMYFSADALAAMDHLGPRVLVPGYFPQVAEVLFVQWKYTIPILVLVPAIQLLMLLAVAFLSRGVLIRDPGTLATARFLKPVIDLLDGHGSALSGDGISDALGDIKVIYGVRDTDGGENGVDESGNPYWRVEAIVEGDGPQYRGGRSSDGGRGGIIDNPGWFMHERFPAGKYD